VMFDIEPRCRLVMMELHRFVSYFPTDTQTRNADPRIQEEPEPSESHTAIYIFLQLRSPRSPSRGSLSLSRGLARCCEVSGQ
jgi:hypothetical protein